jgi:KDEL-tailed cysteine endopeptidase
MQQYNSMSPAQTQTNSANMELQADTNASQANPSGLADIDWVKAGKVSDVDDQGVCGCCWAFAAASMMESLYAIKHNQPVQKFSRQQLIDCVESTVGRAGGCDGGHFIFATEYMKRAPMVLSADYEYKSEKGTCQIPSQPSILITNPIKDFMVRKTVTPDDFYKRLALGPVAINIDASADEFMFYHKGVARYDCSAKANHAVVVVGYGYDKNLGMEYWKIKNSWGHEWGENGYIRIQKTQEWNSCYMYSNIVDPEMN